MSTHLPGFQWFLSFLSSIYVDQIRNQQQKGWQAINYCKLLFIEKHFLIFSTFQTQMMLNIPEHVIQEFMITKKEK